MSWFTSTFNNSALQKPWCHFWSKLSLIILGTFEGWVHFFIGAFITIFDLTTVIPCSLASVKKKKNHLLPPTHPKLCCLDLNMITLPWSWLPLTSYLLLLEKILRYYWLFIKPWEALLQAIYHISHCPTSLRSLHMLVLVVPRWIKWGWTVILTCDLNWMIKAIKWNTDIEPKWTFLLIFLVLSSTWFLLPPNPSTPQTVSPSRPCCFLCRLHFTQLPDRPAASSYFHLQGEKVGV